MRQRLIYRYFPLFLYLLAPVRATGQTSAEARALTLAQADHTAYLLPAGKMAAAEALAQSGMLVHALGLLLPPLILWALLHLGVAARMRNVACRVSKQRWVQGFVFSFELLTIFSLLSLPLEWYERHRLLIFGLSVQSFASWLSDEATGFLLTLVFGALGVMLLFWLMRKLPRGWWIALWVSFCVLTVAGFFVTPYVIDPLFNHFEPLAQTNPALVAQLEKVVARGKGLAIPPERMFLMRASNKTTQLNAYVTGFGASKRIVVWDTSIAKGTPDEIAFIFGHEMGHYVLGHIGQGILLTFVISFFSFWLAFRLFHGLLRRYGPRWSVPQQEDWAALVLLLLVFSLIAILVEPLENNLIRRNEHAADVFGQEAVHGIVADPQRVAQATFQLLGESSLNAPDPNAAYVWLTYTHPPIWLRAAFAKAYDPWLAGDTPRYFSKEK